jgi:hypothetical protein
METMGSEPHLFIVQRSLLNARKDKAMKVAMLVLVAASMLSSTYAFANTARHERLVRSYPMYMDAAPHVVLHPNYGNPNGNPDGPTTLSGTGDSQFGGSSAGTSGYN